MARCHYTPVHFIEDPLSGQPEAVEAVWAPAAPKVSGGLKKAVAAVKTKIKRKLKGKSDGKGGTDGQRPAEKGL